LTFYLTIHTFFLTPVCLHLAIQQNKVTILRNSQYSETNLELQENVGNVS